MKVAATNQRLLALDGLRGIAVIMVVLSHTNVSSQTLPIHPFIYQTLFISGGIGVGFLFVLSGFLMAYLYPYPQSAIDFLQKRYTRIFPLFLTVCLAVLLTGLVSKNILVQFLLFCGIAIIAHVAWVYGLKRATKSVKRGIWISFFSLQVTVGLVYFIIAQKIIPFDLSSISGMYKVLLTGLVNGTLTFFAGHTFPRVDDVYWSLAGEVIFYLLYPTICVPIIAHLSEKRRYIKVLFILALIPLFLGIARLFERTSDASVIRPDFFFHFVGGMTLGYLYRKYSVEAIGFYQRARWIFTSGSILAFVTIFIVVYVFELSINSLIFQMLLTVLYTLVIGFILLPETTLAQVLRAKGLVYIGTVSYSLYLSHIWTAGAVTKILGEPTSVGQTVLYVSVKVAASILFASILYWLLERPYFTNRIIKSKRAVAVPYVVNNNGLIVCVSICAIYLVSIMFAYRINLTYEYLRDPYYLKLATTANHPTQDEAKFIAAQRLEVATEKTKTVLMIIPFLMMTCYLIYVRRTNNDCSNVNVVGRVTMWVRQKRLNQIGQKT